MKAHKQFSDHVRLSFETDLKCLNGNVPDMELANDIDVDSIARNQLDLCKCNVIFCHVDCFFLQERKKGR